MAEKGYHGSFIPIMHEHFLIFIKRSIWQVDIKYTKTFTRDLRQLQQVTWRDLVRAAVEQHGGRSSLKDLYETLDGAKKAVNDFHRCEQMRAVVQRYPEFERIQSGVYAVA